jgi:hypothetical protein
MVSAETTALRSNTPKHIMPNQPVSCKMCQTLQFFRNTGWILTKPLTPSNSSIYLIKYLGQIRNISFDLGFEDFTLSSSWSSSATDVSETTGTSAISMDVLAVIMV